MVFNVNFDLFHLSKYKTHLMGVAALMIILCHAPAYGVEIQGILRKLLVYGNIGVDVFLFLSGMGCWFSLTKSPSYLPWLKRRFFRIFIPYTIILLILRIFSLWGNHVPWGEWLLYFSTVRFWTHHVGMWYVALLVLLYPLTPLLFWGLEYSKRRILTILVLITTLLVLTHIPVKDTGDVTNAIIINLQWAFKRTVSFILGMYIAPYVKQGIKVNTIYIIGASAMGCVLFHFLMKEVFYSWLYVLPLLIILCIFFEKLSDKSRLSQFFLWMGDVSLESYLWNVGLNVLIPLYLSKWMILPLFTGHYLDYSFVVVVGLFLSYATHPISENVKKECSN